MMTIEEILSADHPKEVLEAEKHERDAQVQALRAEMREIRVKLEPHFVKANADAQSQAPKNLSQTVLHDGDMLDRLLKQFGLDAVIERLKKLGGPTDGQ